MRESPPKVITIPAKPEVASRQAVQRQLRVAAYCCNIPAHRTLILLLLASKSNPLRWASIWFWVQI